MSAVLVGWLILAVYLGLTFLAAFLGARYGNYLFERDLDKPEQP